MRHRDEEGELVIYAGIYDDPLIELGLVPGVLDVGASPGPASPPLDRAYELRAPFDNWIDAGGREAFVPLVLPRASSECAPLAGFERQDFDMPTSAASGPLYTVPRRFGSLLIGNQRGLWEADPGGVHAIFGPSMTSTIGPADLAERPFIGAHWDQEGERLHYFFQTGGKIWRTDLHFEMEMITTYPGASDVRRVWMHGVVEPKDLEVFVLDERGAVWRYDGRDWSQRLEARQSELLDWRSGIVWLGSDDVLVIGARVGRVLRLGSSGEEDVTPDGMGTPTFIVRVLGRGIYVGDSDGQVWQYMSGALTRLRVPYRGEITAIGAFNQGILYGGVDGVLGYYESGSSACQETLTLPATVFCVGGLLRGETLLVASAAFFGGSAPFTVTTLKPKPE